MAALSYIQEPCTGLYSGMHNMLAMSIVTHISTHCVLCSHHARCSNTVIMLNFKLT